MWTAILPSRYSGTELWLWMRPAFPLIRNKSLNIAALIRRKDHGSTQTVFED